MKHSVLAIAVATMLTGALFGCGGAAPSGTLGSTETSSGASVTTTGAAGDEVSEGASQSGGGGILGGFTSLFNDKYNYVGKWELVGLTEGDETYSEAQLAALTDNGLIVSAEASEDGTFKLVTFGAETVGAWQTGFTGDTVTLDGESSSLSIEDGLLVIKSSTSEMRFKRVEKSQSTGAVNSSGITLEGDDGSVELSAEVADDELCHIEIAGIGTMGSDVVLVFNVTNKSDEDFAVGFEADTWKVNGSETQVIGYMPVGAGQTIGVPGSIESDLAVEDIESGGGTLVVYDTAEPPAELGRYEAAF